MVGSVQLSLGIKMKKIIAIIILNLLLSGAITFGQECDFYLKRELNKSLKEIITLIESNKSEKISNGKYFSLK